MKNNKQGIKSPRRPSKAFKPLGLCKCGHTGDGEFTAHADTPLEKGHGKCQMDGCKCKRFTWKEFL